MNLLKLLQGKLHEALTGLVPDPAPYSVLVKATNDPRHGDYQANCAMSLAKVLGKPPRTVAEMIAQRIPRGDMLDPPEIAGPGFINLKLKPDWLAQRIGEMASDDRLGVQKVEPARTIVIDYSSPNVAKPMHVGHLRSTIIGESLKRLLRLLGHTVIADNHLGDWGTQFGILLYGYKNFRDDAAFQADPVRELTRLYLHVRGLMKVTGEDEEEKADNPIAEAARQETAKLHEGDPENLRLWQMFMPACLEEINGIYRRLDVQFDVMHGESFYNPMLGDVVRDLKAKGVAERGREGALVVRFGEDEYAVVQKKDGAYTYTTTDLATIRYRTEQWKPDAALYLVDARQGLHFQHLFDAARRWGYGNVELTHVAFGSVLGKDGRPLKTREGKNVELGELLDEAVTRAEQAYGQSSQARQTHGHDVAQLSDSEIHEIAERVGLAAVKYADLSQNRTSDYTFDWDKMLAMDGNTAAYMQYAYARIRSIFRKGDVDETRFRTAPPPVLLEKPQERALAVQLLRFEDALRTAGAEYKPNAITSYLWDLAKSYSGFFENCPVLKADTPGLRDSRLLLCDLTARVIQKGLELLGIRTVERM
jgi:arginyl-tRNA synthetase